MYKENTDKIPGGKNLKIILLLLMMFHSTSLQVSAQLTDNHVKTLAGDFSRSGDPRQITVPLNSITNTAVTASDKVKSEILPNAVQLAIIILSTRNPNIHLDGLGVVMWPQLDYSNGRIIFAGLSEDSISDPIDKARYILAREEQEKLLKEASKASQEYKRDVFESRLANERKKMEGADEVLKFIKLVLDSAEDKESLRKIVSDTIYTFPIQGFSTESWVKKYMYSALALSTDRKGPTADTTKPAAINSSNPDEIPLPSKEKK